MTNETRHTPGPWSVLVPHDAWHGRQIDDWAITVNGHDTWICTGPTWDADKQAESAANAQLIAAAPFLLMALTEAENALSDYVPQLERQGGMMGYGNRVLAACRVAIARATQGAPTNGK